MRIAIANWSNRVIGGTEQYVATVAEYLLQCGHELSFLYEVDTPSDRELIPALTTTKHWNVSVLGLERAMDGLRCWGPDIVYCQGMSDPSIESKLLDVAPSVFFGHNHGGTCISGSRATHFPTIQPCRRRFGKSCLLQFYPRRCGGLNPLTMLRDYDLNSRRLQVLKRYSRVLTHSDAMQQQYRVHGISAQKVRFFVNGQDRAFIPEDPEQCSPREAWRLLMMGRMTEVKGGKLLLESLPSIASRLKKPLDVTFGGDGPCRKEWTRQAFEIQRRFRDIKIRFTGWLNSFDCQQIYHNVDLLTIPSVWPEPFGMVGLEAGLEGIPCVAFDVGGVSQWLIDGVNGCLARGDHLTSANLSEAVVKALSNETYYRKLRAGAKSTAQTWTIQRHYDDLLSVFRSLPDRRRADIF